MKEKLESRITYPIRDISAPSPRDMTEKHKDSEAALVISHMGWQRYCLDAKSAKAYHLFQKAFFRSFNSGPAPIVKDMEFLKVQLTKQLLFGTKTYEYLFEELALEELLEHSSQKDIPTVITIPSKSLGNNGQLVVRDCLLVDNYVAYINSRIKGKSNIYVLPTVAMEGRILGDRQRTLEKAVNFTTTDLGNELLGKLLNKKTIYFAGGAIGACMKATLAYFTQSDNIILLDGYSFPRKRELNPSQEAIDRIEKIMPFLYTQKKEEETRSEILKLLRKFDNKEQRKEDYRDISLLFRDIGKLSVNGNQVRISEEIF